MESRRYDGLDMTMSLYLFLDMYLHSGEYHVGTVGICIVAIKLTPPTREDSPAKCIENIIKSTELSEWPIQADKGV